LATQIASLTGFLIFTAPTDVESDSYTAESYPAFVQVERQGNTGGSLEFRVRSTNSGTVTLSGTPTTSDTVTITVDGNAVTYTLVSGDQSGGLSTTATDVAAALNANATFSALFTASASAAVITISAKEAGVIEEVSLAASTTGGHTVATASGSALAQSNVLAGLTNYAPCTIIIQQ
jgi:hypothetical protein